MKEKILKLVSVVTVLCLIACMLVPSFVKSAQAVVSNMNNTWHGIGNTSVFTVNVNGYSNLYCVNGGAPLNNGTVLNDDGVDLATSKSASEITTMPKALNWICDNIYLTDVTDATLQKEMKENLKNVIKNYNNFKDANGNSMLSKKIGVNNINDNWINTAVEALLNDKTTLFTVQQYAIWKYVKNDNSAYNNAMQNSDGSYNTIPNAKVDKRYYTALYVSLVEQAKNAEKNGYMRSYANVSLVSNPGAITTIKDDKKTVLVGPYTLANNNSMVAKAFDVTVNSEKADKIETVDVKGNTVNVNDTKSSFYIKITYNKGFEKGIEYNFGIKLKTSGYKTFVTLLKPATNGNQALIAIKREAYNDESSTKARYIEELKGNYSLILEKVDSKDSNTKLQGVAFKVQEGSQDAKTYGPTDSNGLVTIVKDKSITQEGVNEYTISEVNVGDTEYIKLKEAVKIYITTSKNDNGYIVSKVSFEKDKEVTSKDVTLEDNSKVTITSQISGNIVKVTIPNKPEPNGKYTLILEKTDSTNQNIKIKGVTFKVQEESNEAKEYGPTGENGAVTIFKDREIKETGVKEYTITEVNVGENKYIKLKNEVKIYITISNEDNVLVASKVSFDKNESINSKEVELEDGTKVSVTAQINASKILISIPNKPIIEGKYTLVLEKTDSTNQNIKIKGVTFKVQEESNEAKEYGPTDENGTTTIFADRAIEGIGVKEYTITEVNVDKNEYIKLKDEVKVYITTSQRKNNLVVSKVSFDREQDIVSKEAELEDGTKVTLTIQVNDNKVLISIPNKKAVFDLALRKFITKINSQNLETNREPVIHVKDALAIQKDGTALYNNPKDQIKVKEGDIVTYKIRIYNEGNIDGYAKEITEYLPDGLEFIENSEINKTNKWIATKNEDGTTIVKTNVLEETVIPASNGAIGYQKLAMKLNNSDENWKDFWKDVEIECKVKENFEKEQNLSNIAEITNYGYMDGEKYIEADRVNTDRDSEEDNVFDEKDKIQEKINEYYNTQYDDNKQYYPGRQDDDDFENLYVEPSSSEFKFVLNKVDENGNPLIGADFTVQREKDNENKVLLDNQEVKGTYEVLESEVQINKTYTYKVIEVESAPEYVNVMEGKYITLKVYMNEKKELVLGNYVKNEEEDYLINKYGFIINNVDGSIVKENETDLYGKIKVMLDNKAVPSKVEITIPNARVEKQFDLALRKFITEIRTGVGSKAEAKQEITNRVPVFKVDKNGNYTYEHTKEPLIVVNDNVVVYTLRVYNEGEVDGYAKEIKDNIPEGLEFLPLYSINEEYRWKMIDKYGKETTEVENAVCIVSDYLSKEQEKIAGENVIKAFDKEKYKSGEIKEPDYREVKVAFRVNGDEKSEEIIINEAQISDDSDSDGNEVTDIDSEPNKWVEGEDDQDIEKIKLQYFDLSLRKWVTKAIVVEDGNQTITETGHEAEDDPEEIVKVDLNKSKISDVTVKFGYSIRVTNEGKIAGYAKEISDYIPEGLKFVKEDNPNWEEIDGKVVTKVLEDTLLQPGDMAEVEIILTWINSENNMGLKVNTAEISEDYNKYGAHDIDSTPNNKVPGEDDIDDAPVMLTVKTGQEATYVGIAGLVLVILASGVVLIKRYVLN